MLAMYVVMVFTRLTDTMLVTIGVRSGDVGNVDRNNDDAGDSTGDGSSAGMGHKDDDGRTVRGNADLCDEVFARALFLAVVLMNVEAPLTVMRKLLETACA